MTGNLSSKPIKILISPAEASSDLHGAALLKELKQKYKQIEAYGIGGLRLRKEGFNAIIRAEDLLAMGFIEIIGALPRILKALRKITKWAKQNKPDIAVVIDYPDFHFLLARRLKKLGIPVVYYIPPKVWAWRRGRMKTLREVFTRVLCILPFEKDIYKDAGINAVYVGNPLINELPENLTKEMARSELQIDAKSTVVTLMPGSRPYELKRHFVLMLSASLIVAKKCNKKIIILVPLAFNEHMKNVKSLLCEWEKENIDAKNLLDIRLIHAESALALKAADAGIIKSGTATLEAGIMELPHLVLFLASKSTMWIYKNIIKYNGPISLVNLVHGWNKKEPYLVNEHVGSCASPLVLANELFELIDDSIDAQTRRQKLNQGFKRVRNNLKINDGITPSALAAKEVLSVLNIP